MVVLVVEVVVVKVSVVFNFSVVVDNTSVVVEAEAPIAAVVVIVVVVIIVAVVVDVVVDFVVVEDELEKLTVELDDFFVLTIGLATVVVDVENISLLFYRYIFIIKFFHIQNI